MIRISFVVLFMLPLTSCVAGTAIGLAGATVGAGVHVAGAVVGATVRTTGAVVGAVTPHDNHDKAPHPQH